MELLAEIAKPRPVGTVQNQEITGYIESYLEDLGYETIKVLTVKCGRRENPFDG